MICEPCKIADENKKQFSFRPTDSFNTGKIKLKPFMTDYTRVNKYLSSHKEELNKYSRIKSKDNINYNKTDNIYNYKISNNEDIMPPIPIFPGEKNENKDFYLQPVMKFQPRTEFERIYDTINSYKYGSIDKNLINEHLKTLGFLTVQNTKNNNNENEYSLLKEKFKVSPQTLSYLIKEKERLEKEIKTPEIVELLTNITDIIKINKEMIHEQELPKESSIVKNLKKHNHKKLNIAKKKIINNYLAKNILSDYQKKTHFKALLNCSLNLEKNNEKYKSLSKGKTHYKNFRNISDDKNNELNKYKYNIFKKNVQNTCIKPFHSQKKYPKEDMEYLKKLCTLTQHENFKSKSDKYKSQIEDGEEENKYLKHTNTVLINGVTYNKKDIHTISKVVLKECNYIKNYFNKEKSGAGKTMITRGLSVNEFTKKYGLPK